MEALEAKKNPKKPLEFLCDCCDFVTVNKKDYTRHLTTRKHIINADGSIPEAEKPKKKPKQTPSLVDGSTVKEKDFKCSVCCKQYVSRGSFWKHTSKCHSKLENLITVTDPSKNTVYTEEVILELVKQNKELQNLLADQNKELQTLLIDQNNKFMEEMKNSKMTVTNSNNNSNNNNHFNIQFFLNTQCKDAINLMDFLDSLKVQIEDLEKTGQLGYVDGISRIFVNGLKEMDVCMRPIHCSDLKRETVYVKDENKWDKDDTDKTKLKYAVKRVAQKNLAQIRPWIEQHPECKDTSTPESETFVQLSHHAIGGCSTTETDKLEEKIMKNILKEIVLDKK
jgi:uncharacterized C2H2 Zn-finger protein